MSLELKTAAGNEIYQTVLRPTLRLLKNYIDAI